MHKNTIGMIWHQRQSFTIQYTVPLRAGLPIQYAAPLRAGLPIQYAALLRAGLPIQYAVPHRAGLPTQNMKCNTIWFKMLKLQTLHYGKGPEYTIICIQLWWSY